ncbi:MAG: hypothetical protein IK083_02210 [Abditibacteriota bacterium]|nr:hypothetical protein [Abditibacteriota bacterium]
MTELIKVATYGYPEVIPVMTGILPAAWMKYRDDLREIAEEYSDLVADRRTEETYDRLPVPSYHKGEWTDPWGCVWTNTVEGMEAIVTGHPYPTRESVKDLKKPAQPGGFPHGFMYLRLEDLRGFEEIMLDFAEEAPELQTVIDTVLEYNLECADHVLKNYPHPMMFFGDDLGHQKALPISPAKWRKYLKPCFAAIYAKFKAAGKYIFMHTDGCIWEIMPDLQEVGVDIINVQYRANGLDNLERVCKGRIPIHLDLDRQLMPFGTPAQIDEHVYTCIRTLGMKEGGLSINIEIGPDYPLENIRALFAAVRKYRTMYS